MDARETASNFARCWETNRIRVEDEARTKDYGLAVYVE